jgi:hypothetical protein
MHLPEHVRRALAFALLARLAAQRGMPLAEVDRAASVALV